MADQGFPIGGCGPRRGGGVDSQGSSDQKTVGNSFQPIGGLISGNCIHHGFRQKVTVDVTGQISDIQFPGIL